MLALVFTLSVALPANTQQAQAPTAKQLIEFFNQLKKESTEGQPQFEIPKDFREQEKNREEFGKALLSLTTPYPTEPPSKIGGRWLSLLDSTLVGPTKNYGNPSAVLRAVPHPDAWPTIAAGLRKNFGSRSTPMAASLVLYGELLGGTPQSQSVAFAKLKQRAKSPTAKSRLESIQEALEPEGISSPPKVLTLTRVLNDAKIELYRFEITQAHWNLAQQNRAQFFKKLFTESRATFKLEGLTPSQVAQLVGWFKETAPKHRVAQWEMVNELDSHQLFPIIAKRFAWAPKTPNGEIKQAAVLARTRHLFGLAARGEIAKAVSAAGDGSTLKLQDDDGNYAKYPSKAKHNIYQFLSTVAKRSPGSPAWAGMLRFAELNGNLIGFESQVRTALKNSKLNPKQRASLQFHHGNVLLKLDQIEPALPPLKSASKSETDDGWEAQRILGVLARLLKRPELEPATSELRTRDRSTAAIFDLVKQGKLDEVKKRILNESSQSFVPDMVMFELLTEAVKRVDGPTVLEIVNGFVWSTPGFPLSMRDGYEMYDEDRPPSLEDVYLKGLLESGHLAEAGEIARKQLYANPNDDDALIALITAEGDAAIPLLDKLAEADPYQERPLIWKAKRLQMSGKLDEAAAVAKAAIKIDPSDGESKGGRRMVVYSVYADILEAQGHTEDAQLYRNAVAAVRKSEDADEFLELGMTQRAVKLYKESLDQFSDAYCIQSRLAHQLATMGRRAEALEHYRKAYELMSSSFGYVETHCFGCEHVFEGEDQQKLAEAIFLEQLRSAPEVPQNHYLLGYLREEQGRRAEAATHFRAALKLAPNYANAAKHLLDLNIPAASEERLSWAALAGRIKQENNWYQDEVRDYRKVYLDTLARIEMFGIKGDPNYWVNLKFEASMPRGYVSERSWSNRNGTPSETIASSRTMNECINIIDFLMFESNQTRLLWR